MTDSFEHLDPSQLGTKAYWDEAYTRELANHAASPEDEGTVWFDDAGAEERVLSHLEALHDDGVLPRKDAVSFLDMGTGNGHMLFALREEGWTGRLVGVDYSLQSVQLCERIRERRAQEEKSEEGEEVGFGDLVFHQYDVFDLLAKDPQGCPADGFDVVLDKGTFDAISLSSDVNASDRRVSEGYPARVEQLVRTGGLLIVTSCNWTETEVRSRFEREGGKLKFSSKINYPTFTFGGKTGSQICTIVFTKLP